MTVARALVGRARAEWPLAIPLVCFAVAATIVPTMANLATTDDWAYTRSVEILYDEGRLVMFPVVAATAVGQVLWAYPFALAFGMELGVTRLSTVVMVAIGAVALYAILRQLDVTRSRSALGTALYLFNPLAFTLSFTFMTDPHFTAWMLVAVALYLRGLAPERVSGRIVVAASIAAGWAFLVRQQGALIPLAVGLSLVASRRLWFSRAGVRLGLQVALAPLVMVGAYYAWLAWINDVPAVQEGFLDRAIDSGWDGTWFLLRHLAYFDAMYLGIFLLPLAVSAWPGKRRPAPVTVGPWTWWLLVAVLSLLIFGVVRFTDQGRRMPYIPQFLGSGGYGPADVPGGRKRLVEWDETWTWLTVAAAIGAVLLTVLLCRRVSGDRSPERAAAGLVGMVAAWQWIGMIPPSYQYINRGGSLDRYLLPLIPLAIAVTLWAVRDLAIVQPAAWLGVAVFGVVSVAGTRDYLVYLDAVWDLAAEANAAGVANEHLDAGSGWDGYHLYTGMLESGITRTRSPRGSPWWVYFYAKQTDSTYLVSTNPMWRDGYIVVEQREYDQWLDDDPVYVYLMRRSDAPWPPEAADD